jgi:hypothetical protein
MYENIQAMLVALCAVIVGIVFTQLGSASLPIRIVGMMLIMGAFVIGITGFLLFIKEWMFSSGARE